MNKPLSTQSEEELVYKTTNFLSRATFAELIESPFVHVQDDATVISALNVTRFQFTNTVPTSVTNFTEGQDGQLIALLGDGNTTLVNNSTLVLGGNILLTANKFTLLLHLGGAWYPRQ